MQLKIKGKKDFALKDFSYNLEKKGNEIKVENYKYVMTMVYFITIVADIILALLIMNNKSICEEFYKIFFGLLFGFLSLPIHELLHAILYKEETYMYMDLFKGRAFVISKEMVSKNKYIFISLFPNFILGIMPIIIGFLLENLYLYFFGIYSIFIGVYDYINVYYVLRTVPNNSKIFLTKNGGFWV